VSGIQYIFLYVIFVIFHNRFLIFGWIISVKPGVITAKKKKLQLNKCILTFLQIVLTFDHYKMILRTNRNKYFFVFKGFYFFFFIVIIILCWHFWNEVYILKFVLYILKQINFSTKNLNFKGEDNISYKYFTFRIEWNTQRLIQWYTVNFKSVNELSTHLKFNFCIKVSMKSVCIKILKCIMSFKKVFKKLKKLKQTIYRNNNIIPLFYNDFKILFNKNIFSFFITSLEY